MNPGKVLFVLIFPLMAQLIVACCDCKETLLFRYTNSQLAITSLDNSGKEIVETNATVFVKTAYGIRLRVFTELACLPKQNFFFIGNSYALSCDCPPEEKYDPKDSITGIKVFTVNNFDNSHPAGSDISAYFKLYFNLYSRHHYSTISDYLKNKDDAFYENEERRVTLNMLLMTAPSFGPQHSFEVEVSLSDGRVLRQATAQLELK
jgi:hypothetical protein